MGACTLIKFGFRVKTRGGTVVENLMIAARDRPDAERKITQMYQYCEILDCNEVQPALKEESFDLERAINLIGKEAGPESPAKD
jgi:hypothetical protein